MKKITDDLMANDNALYNELTIDMVNAMFTIMKHSESEFERNRQIGSMVYVSNILKVLSNM